LEGRSATKPFTAWKDDWLEKDADGKWQFKALNHIEKLLAAAELYAKYQKVLKDEGMVDFNDQIVTVLAALDQHEELRLNLQERFQYIMIDEYQDTNRAQLQLAQHITDAAVHEGRPNILVVGDDDQAIYRFQGADMSNITAFEAAYKKPVIIPLTENYRSNEQVITPARSISTQIQLSLEKQKNISKDLGINTDLEGIGTALHEFKNDAEHYSWIASEIRRLLDEKPGCGKDIAVLARKRDQLDALVPYLHDQKIPIDYERRENILDQEHIVALLTLAKVVYLLSQQLDREANALLPEVLSHPMWNIPPIEIWKVSREAHDEDRLWLDVIFEQDGTALRNVADFLYSVSQQAAATPLEHLIDTLLGQQETAAPDTEHDDEVAAAFAEEELPMQLPVAFISPFKRYYFGDDLFNKQPATYLTMLSHLACLRRHIRNYQQGSKTTLHLSDLIDFVATYQRTGMTMTDSAAHREDNAAVKLMTAHKAKGQEFETVFVIGVNDDVWGRTVGSNNSRFSYPKNLNEIKPSDNDDDDALRLLFVAMTRAKQSLHICYFKHSEDGKSHQPFAPLLAMGIDADMPAVTVDEAALVSQYEQRWLARHAGVDHADKHALLSDKLEKYQLSVTHLNNFLDVSRGGPLYFLTQNLLNFPASMSSSAGYGSAVHKSLQFVHEQVIGGQKVNIDVAVQYFATKLGEQVMSEHDHARFLQKGEDMLRAYLKEALPTFKANQKVEFNFAQEGVIISGARLKGALDLLDFNSDDKTIAVTDYKTGRGYTKWDLPPSSGEYERIKLHHYQQQLL
ncbi:MAG TPA: ATP-dependent DNA helicase, partial [Candidatus Saccharimonadales bacterium]|nr:ATP-dependent DNA helicase [Candidatus Saccharimonadales bacterium]